MPPTRTFKIAGLIGRAVGTLAAARREHEVTHDRVAVGARGRFALVQEVRRDNFRREPKLLGGNAQRLGSPRLRAVRQPGKRSLGAAEYQPTGQTKDCSVGCLLGEWLR